ncbi:uncharacterized protein B0T15DRAFT_527950 [Chaetomium strumarium]|uniref:Uncharacterized protein n=1 Tax=Chaetomium strumarium TaxID=1170767 RepID=A0AAJ0M2J0_9PEZI|nr:hypothetical protein B0T15DRAFT_527950 [Chaetomium strumarium]
MSSLGQKTIANMQRDRAAKNLLEVAPRKTSGQNKPQPTHDRETFRTALHNTGAYLSKKGANITIIAIGDALNTIYLKNRPSTCIDFFNANLTSAELKRLSEAAEQAAKCDAKLDNSWLNNRTSVFIRQDQRRLLTEQALQEGEAIIKRPGLTVLAPPWEYVFCCQVERLVSDDVRDHDFEDAVTVLGWYLKKNGMPVLPMATVKQWFSQYSLRWTKDTENMAKSVQGGLMVRF